MLKRIVMSKALPWRKAYLRIGELGKSVARIKKLKAMFKYGDGQISHTSPKNVKVY